MSEITGLGKVKVPIASYGREPARAGASAATPPRPLIRPLNPTIPLTTPTSNSPAPDELTCLNEQRRAAD